MALADLPRLQLGGGFQLLPLPPGTKQDVLWDFPFILGYVLSLWVAARLAQFCLGGRWADVVQRRVRQLVVGAAVADVVEDVLLLVSIRPTLVESDVRAVLNLVTTAATVKFVCFIPAVVVGIMLVLTTIVLATTIAAGGGMAAGR